MYRVNPIQESHKGSSIQCRTNGAKLESDVRNKAPVWVRPKCILSSTIVSKRISQVVNKRMIRKSASEETLTCSLVAIDSADNIESQSTSGTPSKTMECKA
mmetsp:Transcript_37785/g.53298  ORF Transcript_37785/g.53298 Transcript_37785/m.53298 type:complete len:101 (+) Transcript_37785:708-1010(+)